MGSRVFAGGLSIAPQAAIGPAPMAGQFKKAAVEPVPPAPPPAPRDNRPQDGLPTCPRTAEHGNIAAPHILFLLQSVCQLGRPNRGMCPCRTAVSAMDAAAWSPRAGHSVWMQMNRCKLTIRSCSLPRPLPGGSLHSIPARVGHPPTAKSSVSPDPTESCRRDVDRGPRAVGGRLSLWILPFKKQVARDTSVARLQLRTHLASVSLPAADRQRSLGCPMWSDFNEYGSA